MTSAHPPLLASWLLERFCTDPGLAGDLIEEYQRRQSIRWYWKQTLMAVGAYSTAQIREHKWLALRAVGTGYVIYYLLNVMLLKGVVRPWMAPDTLIEKGVYMALGYGLWLANGWAIAKLHRPYPTAMVTAYVLWSIVASVPPVYERTLSTLAGATGSATLAWELITRLATIFTLLAGGTLAAYRYQLKQTRTNAPGWRQEPPRAFAAR